MGDHRPTSSSATSISFSDLSGVMIKKPQKPKSSIPGSEDKNVICLPDENLCVVLACYEKHSLGLHQAKEKI